ncbi:hypothetical protein [Actinospica acidithermotolerans]|nr:hypothetical protein [Actinospica acidithermotolerans]
MQCSSLARRIAASSLARQAPIDPLFVDTGYAGASFPALARA